MNKLKLKEFFKKYKNSEIIIYATTHFIKNFKNRINGNVKFEKNKIVLLHQKFKGDLEINDIKGFIDIGFGKAILNVYEKNGILYGKVLTVLTDVQLKSSVNFNFQEEFGYLHIKIKDIKAEDKFFDITYTNIFKQIDFNDAIKYSKNYILPSTKEEFENGKKTMNIINSGEYYKIKIRGEYFFIN